MVNISFSKDMLHVHDYLDARRKHCVFCEVLENEIFSVDIYILLNQLAFRICLFVNEFCLFCSETLESLIIAHDSAWRQEHEDSFYRFCYRMFFIPRSVHYLHKTIINNTHRIKQDPPTSKFAIVNLQIMGFDIPLNVFTIVKFNIKGAINLAKNLSDAAECVGG